MLKVRLSKIGGDSLGMTIPKKALQHLRWFQGDNLLLELGEDSITVKNFCSHAIAPKPQRLEYGDAVTRRP